MRITPIFSRSPGPFSRWCQALPCGEIGITPNRPAAKFYKILFYLIEYDPWYQTIGTTRFDNHKTQSVTYNVMSHAWSSSECVGYSSAGDEASGLFSLLFLTP